MLAVLRRAARPQTLRAAAALLATLAGGGVPGVASARVWAPISTEVEQHPRTWTTGGLAGSAWMEDLAWRRWGRHRTIGVGTGRIDDCSPTCAGGTLLYYPGRLVLSRVRSCHGPDGTLRVYTRTRYEVDYPANNPLGQRAGWDTHTFTSPHPPRCVRSEIDKATPARAPFRALYDGAFVIRPDALSTDPLGVFDETSFRASGLQWRRWDLTARATGQVEHCVVEYRPCETHPGTVELGGLSRACDFGHAPAAFEYYTRVRFHVARSDGVADSGWLPLTTGGAPC